MERNAGVKAERMVKVNGDFEAYFSRVGKKKLFVNFVKHG